MIEDYLKSLGEGAIESERGEFTISPERAKALLAGKALSDVWQAWLCLAQGFILSGAETLEVSSSRQGATWKIGYNEPKELGDLLRQDRFLLGWLNLGWFGTPFWNEGESLLTVPWQGHAWKRYRFCSEFPKVMESALRLAPIPVRVDSRSVVTEYLPTTDPMCLYPLPQGRTGGMRFEDAYTGTASFYERRRFSLPETEPLETESSGPLLAAYAQRTKNSWSEVIWVSHGTVIATERNTLERPRVRVVASVQAVGLETDLSGLKVVNDEDYYRFVKAIKRDVLWML